MTLDNFRSQKIIWDKANRNIFERVEVNSGDSNGRKLRVQVLDGGLAISLSGVTLSLAWKTADERYSGLDAFKVVDAALGIFEIYYTTEMLSNVGKLKASLVLVDATGRMESDTFPITVNPTMVDDNAVQSDNSFTALTEALVSVTDLEKNYAPRLNEVNAQLAHKANEDDVYLKQNGININDFDEPTRQTFLEAQGVDVNYVLGEENVRPENTTFLYPSPENIYNYRSNVEGIRFGTDGSEIQDLLYTSSDYIKVESGVYVLGFPDSTESVSLSRTPFYDSEKKFVEIITSGSSFATSRTIEVNVPKSGYIRVTTYPNIKHLLVIARQEDFDGFHTFSWTQDVTALPKVNSVGKAELVEGSVGVSETDFIRTSKNIFNKDDVSLNSFYTTAPITTTLAGYFTLNTPILLKANTTYSVNRIRQRYLYSLRGQLLDTLNTGNNNETLVFTTPNEEVLMYMSGGINNLDITQVEEGSEVTSYDPFSYRFPALRMTAEQIDGLHVESEVVKDDIEVVKTGENFTLKSTLGDGKQIEISTMRYSDRDSGVFNFISTTVDDVVIHANNDDVTPVRTFTTVGANHGYTTIAIVNGTHDKTSADLGSQWTDGIETFTLLLVEPNKLTFGNSYTTDSKGVTSSIRKLPESNLTHVSGATNTTDITTSDSVTGQLYPSIGNLKVSYELDGNEITNDGTHKGDVLQVKERYKILDYGAIIDFAQNNIGTGYADNVDTIDGVTEMTNVYTFRKGLKCTTNHSLRALDSVRLGRCGFLQSGALNASGYNRTRYMMGVNEKEGIDFNKGVDLAVYNTSLVFTHEDSKDGALPPNHYVDWLSNASGRFAGFTMGYIPDKSDSSNVDRVANSPNTWDMRSSAKSYPIAVEGIDLERGDYLSFTGFRNYVLPEETGEAILYTEVVDGDNVYSIADFSETKQMANNDSVGIGKDILPVQEQGVKSNMSTDLNGIVVSSITSDSTGVFKRKR